MPDHGSSTPGTPEDVYKEALKAQQALKRPLAESTSYLKRPSALSRTQTRLRPTRRRMTDDEALREAKRRWPYDGTAQRSKHPTSNQKPCQVGRRIREVFHVLGAGDTWEEAFERAGDRQ